MIGPSRKHVRLPGYNYAAAGYYFVTVCSHNRRHVFGEITEKGMCSTPTAVQAEQCWNDIPVHHAQTALDAFVVMPNHVHGIVVLAWQAAGDAGVAPTTECSVAKLRSQEIHPAVAVPGSNAHSLSTVIGSFKSAVSRKLGWKARHSLPLWQRGFYEHVIRSEDELAAVREYIKTNPLNWQLDELNAHRTGLSAFETRIMQ